ncbi:MAG: CDP-diacylglycerol--glycerol-3-phosphate 3-phosphatidyltransferase [Clostridia bacterium]|nr:CDP-diacylglycerol--glycerol-3-phosphate 3-phosphatidyltransferase [Clostridia bacterium]
MNLPNKISLARIMLIPVFVLFFFWNFSGHYFVAAGVFALAAITDFIDGHIARSRHLVTNLGKFLDPIADKVLIATAFILVLTAKEEVFLAFGRANTAVYILASVSVCIILARELIISAFRQIAAAAGIVLAAEKLGKFKTVFQDLSVFALLVAAGCTGTVGKVVSWIAVGLFTIATVLTIVSGISYVWKNKQVLKDTQ